MDPKGTVLLIDDDELLRGLYEKKFIEQGFTVECAGSAIDALEKLRGGLQPTYIVFDIVMPGLDGYGFIEKVTEEQLATQAVKVALSNQDTEDTQKIQSLPIDAFIVKATAIPSEIVMQVLSVQKRV